MVGVIWYVQLVHYPLFSLVDRTQFKDFQRRHEKWTSVVVAPAMLVEIFTLGWLVVFLPDAAFPGLLKLSLGLLVVIWLSTFLLQVPAHRVLEGGFDVKAHQNLVLTNWVRTLLWSVRGATLVWILL